MEELIKNNKGIKILTDAGFSEFSGLQTKGMRSTVTVKTATKSITCTPDHKLYTEAMLPIEAKDSLGKNLITIDGIEQIIEVIPCCDQIVYDIVGVQTGHRFYANNTLVSNCEFVIYDETLISPLKLLELKGAEPVMKTNTQIRWYGLPKAQNVYCVTLDPSSGTGGDNAAIQIVDVTTMTQIGEWCHNRTPIEGQIKLMMDVLTYLRDHGCNQLYWTVENNTIGEAALVVIRDTGEEQFPGDFLNEPKKVQGKRGRKGFHTGHRSKMEASLSFKRLIENNKLTLKSKTLISELKNFVARNNSFSAKPGETDDLVMAMLLVVRMIAYISSFEDTIFDNVNSSLNDYDDDDEYDGPLPIGFI